MDVKRHDFSLTESSQLDRVSSLRFIESSRSQLDVVHVSIVHKYTTSVKCKYYRNVCLTQHRLLTCESQCEKSAAVVSLIVVLLFLRMRNIYIGAGRVRLYEPLSKQLYSFTQWLLA